MPNSLNINVASLKRCPHSTDSLILAESSAEKITELQWLKVISTDNHRYLEIHIDKMNFEFFSFIRLSSNTQLNPCTTKENLENVAVLICQTNSKGVTQWNDECIVMVMFCVITDEGSFSWFYFYFLFFILLRRRYGSERVKISEKTKDVSRKISDKRMLFVPANGLTC